MTEANNTQPAAVSLIRDLLNEAADVYLHLHEIEITRSVKPSKFELDHEALKAIIGKSTLEDELAIVTSTYLFETAHELKALATLLDANQIAASLEVLSRAAIERCGRISWLLDPDDEVTPNVRAARIALELGVSWQHYRDIMQSLYAGSNPAVKDAVSRFREMRSQIESIFPDIQKEPVSDNQGGFTPSAEIKWWTLGEVSYPDYTELATWAWSGGMEDPKSAKTTYRMLCAFSHPSIASGREHQAFADGKLTYRYEVSYINRIVSNTMAAYDWAFRSFTSYFDRNHEMVDSLLASVHDRWPPLEIENGG